MSSMVTVDEMDRRVREGLARAKERLPTHVVDLRYKLDMDWAGDDGIYVWIIIDDAAPESSWEAEATWSLREVIKQALAEAGADWWPYLMVRARSEQAELDDQEQRERQRQQPQQRRR